MRTHTYCSILNLVRLYTQLCVQIDVVHYHGSYFEHDHGTVLTKLIKSMDSSTVCLVLIKFSVLF